MYRVHLQDFEGPLDLLLFFIRRDELDIFNIPIARIADEYLEYVRVLEQIDLDSVGDFLYMSALLINVKARMLLPSEEVDEEGEPIDPRKELVERLLEYVRYKEASQELTSLHDARGEKYTRGLAGLERKNHRAEHAEVKVEASVFDLVSALRRVLTAADEEPSHQVQREDYSIEQQRAFIREHLSEHLRISFVDLVRSRSRAFIIATFLAVLEMARLGEVLIYLPARPNDFFLGAPSPDDPSEADDTEGLDQMPEAPRSGREGE